MDDFKNSMPPMGNIPPFGAQIPGMGGMPPMGNGPMDGPGPMGEMPDADISAIKNCRLDLRYGEGERQVFDIYYPEDGSGPWPVLLHMHGGGFAMGDKRDFHIQELLDAVNHGYVFASCNYRRSGNAPFPAAVVDCRKFVDYLHNYADELNIDADKICAFGGSAGGNLSAMFAMNIEKFSGETEPVNASVACAIDWFGPLDFASMDGQVRASGIGMPDHDAPFSPESKYIGAPLQKADPELLKAANPISYINSSMKPILIQHGTRDMLVPFAQSEELVEAIRSAGFEEKMHWIPLEGAGHDDSMFKSDENLNIMWAFLDKYLKGIEPETPLEEMPLPELKSDAADLPFGLKSNTPFAPVKGSMPPSAGHENRKDGNKIFSPPPIVSDKFLNEFNNREFDISYGPSKSQVFDLWLPNERKDEKIPVIIHFHGGAFAFGDKRESSAEPMLMGLYRGYAVISAEYRKSGEAIFPAMVYDAKTVIRWTYANAEKYGFDTERIALWGPSSGGWLSSFTAVTTGIEKFEDRSMGWEEYPSNVAAVVDWCGPCAGFLAMDEAFLKSNAGKADHNEPNSPESRFLGKPITECPELVNESSPASYVNADTVPFLIVHGGDDQVVPVEQSIAFAEAINSAAGDERAVLKIVPGKKHHGDPWYHEPWVSEMCFDFLDKVFGRV